MRPQQGMAKRNSKHDTCRRSASAFLQPQPDALDHLRLAAAGELGGEEAGEVALQEAEDEDVADGGDRRDEDHGEGHEHYQILRRLPDAAHLPRLERAACACAKTRRYMWMVLGGLGFGIERADPSPSAKGSARSIPMLRTSPDPSSRRLR